MVAKIVHYLRHLDLGGTTKTCQLFFEHLKGFDQTVVYEKSGDHTRLNEFEKAAIVCGGRLFEVDSYRDGYCDGNELQQFLRTNNTQILHVYRSGYREFPENGEDVDVPFCVETNVFGFYDSNLRINKTLFMSKWLYEAVMSRFAPISRGMLRSRFDWVNNPVEMPYTDQCLPIADRWRNEGATILGRVGRPDNGIYNAINVRAAAILRSQGMDVRFLVVAPPPNMVNDLVDGEIPFYVVEPTVNPLVLSTAYNSMDIYAHARADGETFGVNIAEAMIHGKPVVTHVATPSVPGMGVFQAQTQLVATNRTGFVVANNVDYYTEALKRLVQDKGLRQEFGSCGLEKAEREFRVDVCVKKLENIYREVLE